MVPISILFIFMSKEINKYINKCVLLYFLNPTIPKENETIMENIF